ncbi:MAG: family 78 glycoside hydrolase catalytic domain [Candidatus Sumerlaeaceae bacterium]
MALRLCRFAVLLFASGLLMNQTPVSAQPTGAGLSVTQLRCENLPEPINIDTPKPRFSWVLTSTERAQRQSAYQLLAASSRELLEPGKADLWDSGRISSDQSILVEYAGKPLRSDQQVFWTVRVWDARGAQAAAAEPASFTTALLQPSEWSAKWIGSGDETAITSVPMERASWIWAQEPEPAQGKLPQVGEGVTCTFVREFTLPSASITSAVMTASADNSGRLFLNNRDMGEIPDWEQARQFTVTEQLKPGASNTVRITATNGGDHPNPAGLVGLLYVRFADGTTTQIATDSSWRVSIDGGKASPSAARVLGPWGMKPWERATVTAAVGPRPIFRKQFALAKPIRRAVVHICGLGHHKLFVNGKPAADTFLDPPWAEYRKTAFYNTYDITSHVRQGDNAFGVMLANGFFNTAGDRRINGNHASRPLSLIVQARVEYTDGTTDVVQTDDTWQCRPGPYTHTAILGGADYDARQLPNGWASAGAQSNGWSNAALSVKPQWLLSAAISPSLRTFEEFQPASITEPAPGHYVYDFGQNASAAPRLRVKGPAGSKVRLTYSEQRQGSKDAHNDGKGLADQSGIRSPNYLEYTLRGGEEESWFSDLYYSGYQYMEVTGAVPNGWPNPENKPVLLDLKSVHVRSGAPTVGTFNCSDPMYEKIDRMVDWSVRSNLSHVLTDCPHREKMGWLEVIHLMWPSIASRYDLARFGPKVARDIRDAQQPSGEIFTVAPAYPDGFPGGFQYTPEWGASGVLIPWYTYVWYGDRRVLVENYDCMHRFVDYMSSTAKDYVPVAGLGDWYDYGHGQELGASRFTPTDLTAMCIYADCAGRVSQAAGVLGRSDDERKYRELTDKIRESFNRHFQVTAGEYKNNGSPQTANAMALVTGMVSREKTSATVERIVGDMQKRGWQQTAGDVGFHYLVRALADGHRHDALFKMLARTELGSYQFLANAGWTALPESWNAYRHYSMNHCMLGHIQEWFSQDLAGIAPDESGTSDSVGFKHFHLRPVVDGPITSATAALQSPYGEIRCSWVRVSTTYSSRVFINATVPVNTRATLHLPSVDANKLLESGRPVGGQYEVRAEPDSKRSTLLIGSGNYQFEFPI